jgi:hypothetical protein
MRKFVEKECKKHGLTEHVLERNKYYRCKKCRVESVIQNRRNRKLKLITLFGGKCELCGYDRCQEALQFHHVHNKEFGIAQKGVCRSWQAAVKEANKCVLVCSNCHAEVGCGIRVIPTEILNRVLLV